MSTFEFTATITPSGQIEVPSNVAAKLKPGERARVVVTVGGKKAMPPGTPGKDLLKLAGLIPPDELKRISDAIEEEFETIDPN